MFNRDRFIYPMSIGEAFKMVIKDEIQLAWSDFQINATQYLTIKTDFLTDGYPDFLDGRIFGRTVSKKSS